MKKIWSNEEINYLKENYKTMSANDIAKNIGRTRSAVQIKANRIGLKAEKYYYDRNYFEEIKTPNQAYWLGFFYADGYVTKSDKNAEASIELKKEDSSHLKKLNKCVGGNVEVCFRHREESYILGRKIKDTDVCLIRFFSVKMVNDLISHGCVQRKSFTKKKPSGIPEELMRDFIRGYFDGNGTISSKYNKKVNKYYLSVSIETASDDFVKWLSDYLNDCGFSNKYYDDTSAWKIIFHAPSNYYFLDYIYKDAEMYLERKYKKYITAVSDRSDKFGQKSLKGKIGESLTADTEVTA